MKDCVVWEEPHTGAEEQHEEARAAEAKCYELTATPIPILLSHSAGGSR